MISRPPLPSEPIPKREPFYRTSIYTLADSVQRESLARRLAKRRITPRLLSVYVASAALMYYADPDAASFVVGAVIVMLGLAVRLWAFGHLRKNARLITTGPYAYTRNPAYVGSALVMIGMFAAAGNSHNALGLGIWTAGVASVFVFGMAYMPRKCRNEYANLARRFPAEAARHAAHVPDFFPRLTPWRSGDSQRFSWACAQANNEMAWPIICAVALAFIAW